jgi:DNA polymerase-1
MKKLYLIDASGFLFRAYFAIRNITNARGESTNALFGFIRSLLKLFKDFHPDHVVAVFDGENNSAAREAIYEQYKAHRSECPKDLGYQIDWAREFCELMGIPHLNISNVEADDTMGTVAKWAEKQGYTSFLCTSDKDMCQLVNEQIKILNTYKDNLILGPAEVEENFGVRPDQIIDLLAIIGDSSDNVPGVSGIGPKTASALLKEYGTLDNLLAQVDQLTGKKREQLTQGREMALLSRKLVELNTEVEVPHDESFYKLGAPNRPKLREFYADKNFNTLIKELEETPAAAAEQTSPQMMQVAEETDYQLVDDQKALQELVHLLAEQKEICFKTFADDWHPMRGGLVGMAFCVKERQAYYLPVNGSLGLEAVVKAIKPIVESPHLDFFGHNVKFDIELLSHYGIKIPHLTFDTILASYLLNSHIRQHSVDSLALEYWSRIKSSLQSLTGKGKHEIPVQNLPALNLTPYCCEEADLIFRLKQHLSTLLEERNLSKVLLELELPLTSVLAEMERHGIYVDVADLQEKSKEFARQIRQLEGEIYQLAGEEFNLNSPKQLSAILFQKLGIHPPKKTATGHSTNAEVLESLVDEHPIAAKLLEYRAVEKLRSTYVDALPAEVNSKTKRIHCNFNQTVAATGRLSCQDPNLQNIPVRTELGRSIRGAFKPQQQGWSFLGADYSQIELRLLAHFSEDPTLIEAFQHHQDIHAHTAATVMNIPIEQVTPEQRHQAKAVNFGIVYGQQAFGLSQGLKIDVKEASAFIKKYFERYSHVKAFVEGNKQKARETGKAVTIIGRERLIPEIHSKNFVLRGAAERLAMNTPLQGSAADLIKLAMLEVDRQLRKHQLHSFMILQIHDELVFEAPDQELDQLKNIVKTAMEGIFKLKVPLVVNISIGKNWEEC